MTRIRLTVLTPLHIGSGKTLSGNSEFLYFRDKKKVAIIDENKVLSVIGPDQITQWINHIEQPQQLNFLEYLRRRKTDLEPEDVAQRVLPLIGDLEPKPSQTLKEFIRGGNGQPYIPGSSIKGAIRTAIFGSRMLQQFRDRKVPINFNTRMPGHELTKQIFGRNENDNIMRILQISDFSTAAATKAVFSETVNQNGYDLSMKNEVMQLIEVLPQGAVADGSLKVNQTLLYRKKHDTFSREWGYDLHGLFRLINQHTSRILDDEDEYMSSFDLPEGADELISEYKRFQGLIKGLNEGECIFRMSFGSGYRFMTGHWTAKLLTDPQYNNLDRSVRRGDRYFDYSLPKSRKVVMNGVPMGFVKMKIVE